MKNIMLGLVALALTCSGSASTATQGERRQNATVQLNLVDPAGKKVELSELSQADRQSVNSLRTSLQQWGNQQAQRVKITISCTLTRPRSCSITIEF